MPPFSLDMSFRKTPEYRMLREMVLTECPGLCDYMVDMAIMMSKRYPDLQKRYKATQQVEHTEQPNGVLEGAVFIE